VCGFAGFLSFGSSPIDAEKRRHILQRMGNLLAPRGPDDQTLYDDGALSLVYRRLSIVDVAGGRQPIWSEDDRRFIVVNGEIYNHVELRRELGDRHRFSTRSDSEVPLHLFEERGVKALDKLRGMFALAIWNREEKSLFLARDRLGIKPLYICRLAHGLLFGSELKALLAHPDCPRDISWEDLFMDGPQALPVIPSYVRGVEHLPGGHYLIAQNGRVETHCWWRIDNHLNTAPFGADASRYQSEFEALVESSVAEHLLGEVPIGLHLSGGADSSLIASLVAPHTRNLACFSVVDRNTWQVGDVSSAQRVTEQLGLPWYPVLFDQRTLLDDMQFDLRRMEQSVQMMDSPRFDLEWIFKEELHRFARRQHPGLKVILIGQGMDEFSGGYSRRLDYMHPDWNAYINNDVRLWLRYWRAVNTQVPDRLRRHVRDEAIGADLPPYHRLMRLFVQQLQHFQLWHEDRTSSSQSLEARVPFLDHRLIELLASVPGDLHEELFWNKRIVRDALNKRLPGYDPKHPKVQFFISSDTRSLNLVLHEMLRRSIPAFLDKYLDEPSLPFERDPFFQYAKDVINRKGNFYADGWRLAECMAIAMFARQCRDPEADNFDDVRASKSGPPAIPPSQWQSIGALFEHMAPVTPISWSPDDRLALPEGAQVLVPLESAHSFQLASDGTIYSSITVPQHLNWVGKLLRHLQSSEARDFTLNDWAEEFDLDQHTLVTELEMLHLAGFIEQRPATKAAIR
jgi:asparagine synthase (glutamine-hydrolysing)